MKKHTSTLLRQLGLKNMLIPADSSIDEIYHEVLEEFQQTLRDKLLMNEDSKDDIEE